MPDDTTILDLRTADFPSNYDEGLMNPPADGLVNCPGCGRDVDGRQGGCPNCGHPISNPNDPYDDQIPGGVMYPTDDYSGWNEHAAHTSKWHLADNGVVLEPHGQSQPETVDGPFNDYDNVGEMSREQKGAFQTWVDEAVDRLNEMSQSGQDTSNLDVEDPQLIESNPLLNQIAQQLSHDGCPDPQAAIRRALMQPLDENGQRLHSGPGDQEEGTDLTEMAPAADPSNPATNGAFQTMGPTGQSLAHVQTTTGAIGRVVARWNDLWDVPHIRIVTAEGKEVELAEAEGTPVEVPELSPVNEIQAYIDNFPQLEPTMASMSQRIQELGTVRSRIRKILANHYAALSDYERYELDQLDMGAQLAIMNLHEAAVEDLGEEKAYLASQPAYRIAETVGGYGDVLVDQYAPVASDAQLEAVHNEHPEIVVDELHPLVRSDEDAIRAAAAQHIDLFTEGLTDEMRSHHRDRFIEAVHEAAMNDDWAARGEVPDMHTCPNCEKRVPADEGQFGKPCSRCGYEEPPSGAHEASNDDPQLEAVFLS